MASTTLTVAGSSRPNRYFLARKLQPTRPKWLRFQPGSLTWDSRPITLILTTLLPRDRSEIVDPAWLILMHTNSLRHSSQFAIVLLPLLAGLANAAESAGEAIYKKECLRCHGPLGQGTKKAEAPLGGDKSIDQLAVVVQKTMPETNPGKLTLAEAKSVAAWMYDAFYSPAAQAKIRPPRVELSHLTVSQYRNAVSDLIASFRGPVGGWGKERGLRGQYHKSRNFDGKQKVLERLDPEIKFDWKTETPVPEKIEPHEFAIRWNGSLLVSETGTYDIVLKTEQATRLWVNDQTKPLIDAWVKSGSDTEFRGSIFLLAGRAYSLRLETSKAKQGVNDKKKPPKPVPASLTLAWKPPGSPVEPIPARNLSPTGKSEVFAPATPFPPDDRSFGWERATTVSKAWEQATTDAAIETATYVSTKLNELAKTKSDAKDRDAKLREFATQFAERAFRRPLTPDQKQLYIDRQFQGTKDPEVAVRRVVILVLKSPRFLYREVGSPTSDAYDTAARLSFALWDSPPDADLLKVASANQLSTPEQLRKQAERMLNDPRATAKLREFLLTWLKAATPPDLAKDSKRFPGFDSAMAADLRASLELMLDDVVWNGNSDFRKLLTADELFLNGRLAKFYGAKLAEDAGFEKVKLQPEFRAGILTHPYLMAAFAYTGTTSPIHRGVFVARNVLGVSLRPPQEAFTPLPESAHPEFTTRERVAFQTKPAACSGCHGIINNLGFTLENFDAVGRFRDTDNKKKVDAAGSFQTRTGEVKKFTGPKELAKFLVASEDVHAAFAEQMFHHLVKQPVRAFGVTKPEELRKSFAENGYSIRKLAVEVAVTAAMTNRDSKPVALAPASAKPPVKK